VGVKRHKLATMPLADLVPADYNPRRISDEAMAGLGASLDRFGLVQPIVWNQRTGRVVGGHQRIKALADRGATEADVVVVDLPDAEEKALNVALNSPAISGEFTEDLNALLDEISGELPDVYDALLLDELRIDTGGNGQVEEDEAPELRPAALSRPGDLWHLGEHRVLCGDCTDAEAVTRLMDGAKAKLVATDPPYGVNYSKTKDGIPRSGFAKHNEQWGDLKNDGHEGPALQDFLERAFTAALPHLDCAAWYLWHAHLTQGFFAAAAAANVVLHRQIIWRKPGFVLTRSGMYHWSHEPCFYGWVKGHQPQWLGNKSQTSVWECGRDEDSGQHPTQKPIELFAIPIRNHLKQGEVCYEPFAGSGSQFIAAEQLGRKCYGIEIEPRYVDVICRRWHKLTGRVPHRDDGTPFPVASES